MAEAMPERVARRATKGFVALTGGRAFSLALQFVAFAITAGALGPTELGVYSFAVAFIGLFRAVTNFGFRAIVSRDIAQHPEREDELISNLAWLRFGLGALAWLLVVGVVHLAGFEPDQRNAAIVTGALLLFLALESFEITLEVRLRTGWPAVAEIVKSAILAVGAAALAAGGRGVTAFLVLYVVANVVRVCVPTVVALRSRTYAWRPKASVWVAVARAAAFLGLAQLCISLYYRLDLLLLARISTAEDVGQYAAAYQFLETFVVLPSLAMVVLTPIISRSVVEGDTILRRRLAHVLHLVTLVALPVAVLGALAAWRVLPLVPGFADFEGGGVALSVLAPSTIAIFLGTVLSGVLVAAHRQRLLFWLSLAGLGLNVVLNLALIPAFTYVGAAVATSVTEVFLVVASLVAVRRVLGIAWPLRDAARAARAAGLMAVVLALGLLVHPLVQVVAGALVYVVALLPSGSLRWSDLGGLVASGGEDVTLSIRGEHDDDGVVVVTGDEPAAVVPAGARSVVRALQGAGQCTVVPWPGRRTPVWVPVAARVAGCNPVRMPGERPSGLLRRLVWPWFLDPPTA
jgi:O-antigen/teichoic acid export membrane protein